MLSKRKIIMSAETPGIEPSNDGGGGGGGTTIQTTSTGGGFEANHEQAHHHHKSNNNVESADDEDDDDEDDEDDESSYTEETPRSTDSRRSHHHRNNTNNNNTNNRRTTNNNNYHHQQRSHSSNTSNNSTQHHQYNHQHQQFQHQQQQQQPIFFAESRHEFAEVTRDVYENRESVRRMKMRALRHARKEAMENYLMRLSDDASSSFLKKKNTAFVGGGGAAFAKNQQRRSVGQENQQQQLLRQQEQMAAQQKYREMLLNGERSNYLQKLTIEDDFSYDGEEDELDFGGGEGGSEDEGGLMMTSTSTIYANFLEDDFEAALRSARERRQQQQQQAETSSSREAMPSLLNSSRDNSNGDLRTATPPNLGNGTMSTNYNSNIVSTWRMKDRMKTTSVALVLCLNIGVDPPDCLKVSPCARAQCWINPLATPPQKALDAIGKALQAQYERWQPRAKYRLQLDPTVEDVKKLCLSCRRSAKNERVLFHYNGHGVPRPTQNGEVWVFNKNYTQYIPLSLYDMQQWTGAPAIYLFDCSSAGTIVKSFLWINEERKRRLMEEEKSKMQQERRSASGENLAAVSENYDGTMDDLTNTNKDNNSNYGHNEKNSNDINNRENIETEGRVRSAKPSGAFNASNFPPLPTRPPTPAPPIREERIVLAACSEDESLPQSVELPADVFTACLTTPIKIALQWFVSRSVLKGESGVSEDIIDKIPGLQNNRKTPLGELNWIFTAITDTIAWNVLPRPLFQQLFRQDLLLASLFRNFLLAERIMRANDCTPVSIPELPPTHQHPMWLAWDMAVENCLLQIPDLIEAEKRMAASQGASAGTNGAQQQDPSQRAFPNFTPSSFFSEQLTAFEVWLERGDNSKDPPEQLPIVLQVLLSQSHRLRALVLLGRFLDMGPWAVDLALSVGIFPYVLKLLQTTAPDLRQILVFIWTKILAFDRSCQVDLVKDSGHTYFIRFLDAPNIPAEERAMAAFVLASVCDNHPKGQSACLKGSLVDVVLAHISRACDPRGTREATSPLLAKWLCLCLAKLCEDNVEARRIAFRAGAVKVLSNAFSHQSPDARSAAAYALGVMIDVPEEREAKEKRRKEMEDLKMASMGFPQTQHQQGGSNDSMLRPSSRGSRVQSRSLSRVEKIESEAELLGRKLSGIAGEGSDEGKQHHGHSGSTGVGIGSIEQQNGESVYDGTGVISANDVDEEQQRRHEEHERELGLRRQQHSDEREAIGAILSKLSSDSCTSTRCEMAIAIGRFARGHSETFQATAQKWRKRRESKQKERRLLRGGSVGNSGGNIVGLDNELMSVSARPMGNSGGAGLQKPSARHQRRYSAVDDHRDLKAATPIEMQRTKGAAQERHRSLSNLGGFAERYSFSSGGGSHDGVTHFPHMRRVAESDSDDPDDSSSTSNSDVEESEDDEDVFESNVVLRDKEDDNNAQGSDNDDDDNDDDNDYDEDEIDGNHLDSQKGSSGDTLTDEQPMHPRKRFPHRSNSSSFLTKNLYDQRDEEITSHAVLVALADLAVDPSPRVASCGQSALLCSKLHSKHPISLAATRAETFGAKPGRQARIQRERMRKREDLQRKTRELLFGSKFGPNSGGISKDSKGRIVEASKSLKRADSWSSRLFERGRKLLGSSPQGSHGSLDIHNIDNKSDDGSGNKVSSRSPEYNMLQRTTSERAGDPRSLGRLSITSRSSISINTTVQAFSGGDRPENSPPAPSVLARSSVMMQSPPQSPLRRVASSLFNSFKSSGSNPDIARGDSETLARSVSGRVARMSLNDEEMHISSSPRSRRSLSMIGGHSDSSDKLMLARQDSNDSANENKQNNPKAPTSSNDDLFNLAEGEASLQGRPAKPPLSRLFEASREHFSKSLLEPEEDNTTDFDDDDRDSEDSDSDQGTFSDADQDSYDDDYSDGGSSVEKEYTYAYESSFAQARRDANATFNAFNGNNNNAGAKNNEEFFDGDYVDTSSEKYYNIDNYFYEGATLSQRQQRQEIILEPFRRRKRRQTASDRSYRGKERATQNLVDFTNVIASHENVQNSRHNAPTAVVMHPLLPHIASSGGKGLIRVFDYASKTITNAFDAQLPTRSATQISLVNQLDDAMLLCAGSDGSVKLWRDYFRRGEETLVAAWRTLKSRPRAYKTHGTYNAEDTADWRHHHSSHHPKNSKTNAVVLWQQAAGCLYSAGNTLPNPILNVWDASRELCLESLVTPSAATSLAAEGALLMVGANDGSVLSYDLRTPARLLSAIKTHGDSVVSILLQPGSVGNLVATGSSSGDVHFCDLRNAAKPFFMVNVSGKPVARQDYDEGTTLDGNAIDSVVGGVSGAAKTNQPSPLGGGGGRHSSQSPAKKRLLTTLISTPVAPCIVGGTTKDAIKIWDVEGNEIGEVLYTNKTTKARLGAISAMAFHPNQMCYTAGDIRGATTVFGMSEDVL